jgi:hypothetical protein
VAVSVRIDINNRLVNWILRSPAGPVAKNMLTRGQRVRRAAQRNVNSQSGALAHSIRVEIVIVGDRAGVQVGTNLHYARFVHDGTGIYGPSHRPIRPTRRKALAFSGRSGGVIVASSRGQRGTKFLERALHAAR